MGRAKLVPRVFEEGQVILFKRIQSVSTPKYRGFDAVFIMDKYLDSKNGNRYIFLEINIDDRGQVHQRKFDYAEATFRQRIRGFEIRDYYQELDKDTAKLEVVISSGKSVAMIIQEAIENSKKSFNRRIDWYQNKIQQEQEILATLEKAKGYIE